MRISLAKFLIAIILAAGTLTAGSLVPGGMVAVTYYWRSASFSDMEFFININRDPGTDDPVFWAHQFWFLVGDGGYIGIQTNGYITEWVGNMFIFSIWNAEAGVAGEGATCLAFEGEGIGWSCRLPMDWHENQPYRLRIAHEGNDWWGAWVMDLTTSQEQYLGRIKVPEEWGLLQGVSDNFTEYYGSVPSCEEIDYAVATFNHPTANNGSLTAEPYNPRTYGLCESFAQVACSENTCTHIIGSPPYKNYLPCIIKE